MPIKLPSTLPAYAVLSREGVMVLAEDAADRQDIRPLRIALLNLMPKKIQTEYQMTKAALESLTRNTAAEHMEEFYRPFADVVASGEKFDGLIITGAPIEHLPFQDVTYWKELEQVFAWTQTHVHSTFGVCWGGMAMINHFHGVQKHLLDHKAFGCFRHTVTAPASPYLRGFSDDIVVPVSRWTEMKQSEIDARPALHTLITSAESGPCLVEDTEHRALYVFNHFEYDSGTLKQEYDRDVAEGTPINVPCNYYPHDDPANAPQNRWRSHAHLLYGNWINEIYQTTKYDLNEIGT